MTAVPVILVCDDDVDDQILIEQAFAEAGIKVDFQFTNDGLELVHYLENCNGGGKYPCPSIILLDLNMPKMNGVDALKWVKSHSEYRAIPVVIYTTSNDKKDIRQCYRLGANTFMTKSSQFEDLMKKVNAFAKFWINVAKLP